MKRITIYVVAFLAASAMLAQDLTRLTRVESPTEASVATAREAAERGEVFLVFHDGTRFGTRGDWKFKSTAPHPDLASKVGFPYIITAHDLNGTLISAREAQIDFDATNRFNVDLRAGLYEDAGIAAWQHANLRHLTQRELRAAIAYLRGQGAELEAKIYAAEDNEACGGIVGAAGGLCRVARELGRPSPAAAFDQAVAQRQAERP